MCLVNRIFHSFNITHLHTFSLALLIFLSDEGAFEHRDEEIDANIDFNDNYNDTLGDSFIGDNLNDMYEDNKVEEEIEVEVENMPPGALKTREMDFMSNRNSEKENAPERKDDFSARTVMVRDILKDQLRSSESVSFSSISKGISRRTAAACFLEVRT